MKEVMALKQARMAPSGGGNGDVEARAAWEVGVRVAYIACMEDGSLNAANGSVRFTKQSRGGWRRWRGGCSR